MFSGLEHSEESPRAEVSGAYSLGPNPPNPRARIASGAGRKMAHIVTHIRTSSQTIALTNAIRTCGNCPESCELTNEYPRI